MEDVNKEEVGELVGPEDDSGGKGGDVVHLGEGQQGGDGNREHVPRYQPPLHTWITMITNH